jgi:DNA-binding NarL/FixJ family response regulator
MMPHPRNSKYEGTSCSDEGLVPDKTHYKPREKHVSKVPDKIKVLLVHYIGLICKGAASLIGGSEVFEVCGITNEAAKARRLFQSCRPRVVIVGPTLQGGDGIQLIKEMHKMNKDSAILMLSAHEDAVSVQRAFHAGALGYLRIFDGDRELLTALQNICARKHYVSEGLRETVFKNFANGITKGAGSKIDRLTDREREVVSRAGKGSGVCETAAEMGLSPKTIESYLERIKRKLELRTNAELREKATRFAAKSAWKRMERLHA